MFNDDFETERLPALMFLDLTIDEAKRIADEAFYSLEAPDQDIQPFALLAGPVLNPDAFNKRDDSDEIAPFTVLDSGDEFLVVSLPPDKYDLFGWCGAQDRLPTLLRGQKATACAIGQMVWGKSCSRNPAPPAGADDDPDSRQELLHVTVYHQRGESVLASVVERRDGERPEAGDWHGPDQVSDSGLWPSAIHAALRNYDLVAQHWPFEDFEAPVGIEFGYDLEALLQAHRIHARVFEVGEDRYAMVALEDDSRDGCAACMMRTLGVQTSELTLGEYSTVLKSLLTSS